ncbi:hypothetical protein BCV71DRAFT_281490 [Rhizopus microsporus]|uniref:Uncharacterized protein n=1 Tax=Rhizopus microsporus TaxID=58291 RepID=A0A1X0RKI8_RHIZD|nr:hypothetical protein BCV71DRAFT_281490 [Rhizopus microsporus]
MTGIGIRKLKQHASWSLRTDTFERHHLRPPQQHQEGKTIASAVLTPLNELTQKTTTSEDETKDVVRTRP